ncbi:MAG: DUF2442 domain-containing protein [Acidobacteria bacterium]|nr:DUF2442 domain-containing protein [Acidobacteriota bacterium]
MDRFVICIDHGGYAASLEIGKVYRVHTAPTSSPTGYALVVDESGEPYAYPKSCFRSIRLSAETRRRLLSPPAESPRRSSKALAASASCTASSLVVALADGRTITAPLAWFPRLQSALPRQRAAWTLLGAGEGIRWEALDEDVSVARLLDARMQFPTQASATTGLATRPSRRRAKKFHRLVIRASRADGEIWLDDGLGSLVQRAVGVLKSDVRAGDYVVAFSRRGKTYRVATPRTSHKQRSSPSCLAPGPCFRRIPRATRHEEELKEEATRLRVVQAAQGWPSAAMERTGVRPTHASG